MSILSQPKQHLRVPSLKRAPQLLPNIYSKINKPKKQTKVISIFAQSATIQKAIAKSINFKSQKVSCLQQKILNKISQSIKSVSYQSNEYKSILDIVKQIFIHCGFQIKERDILVTVGAITGYNYAFFTSYQQHPYSLCCDQVIVIKVDQDKASLQCLECKSQIIKFLLNTDLSKSREKQKQQERNKQKLKISYSMMIASGRYRKYRIGKSSKGLSLAVHERSLSKLDKVNETMQKNQPFCQG